MVVNQIAESLGALADRLLLIAADDEPLRLQLRELAEAILTATAEGEPVAAVSAAPAREGAASPSVGEGSPGPAAPPLAANQAMPAGPAEPVVPAHEAVRQLRLGGGGSAEAPPPARIELPAGYDRSPPKGREELDLELVERRCRLKGEASRWAAERRRRIIAGAEEPREIAPRDRELQIQALDLPQCHLWMAPPNGPIPDDLSLLENLAGSYDALADALAFMRSVLPERESQREFFEEALRLLAEAQSSVRGGGMQLDGPEDYDQKQVFLWLRHMTREHSVYVDRYMQARDVADPAQFAELAERIGQEDARFEEARSSGKQRRKLLNKIRYLTGQISAAPENAESWPTLVETVVQLVEGGVPPSDRQLRELLLPVIEQLPAGEDPPALQLVLREMDRYLRNSTIGETAEQAAERSAEVRQVAELLRGTTVFLIGGERRNHSHDALVSAFELEELVWFATREHESVSMFESYVARPEVKVVLLAIRWSSHSYGEVKEFCDNYGKPLVRLPAGYNPNQVARQILDQAADRLRS